MLFKKRKKTLPKQATFTGHWLLWAAWEKSLFCCQHSPSMFLWEIICYTYPTVRLLLLPNLTSLTPLQVIS